MRFTASIADLAKGLGRVSGAIPPRSPMPALENVLLQLEGSVLTLTATDMDISISTRILVKGERNGSILVPA